MYASYTFSVAQRVKGEVKGKPPATRKGGDPMGDQIIFRATITLADGTVLRARDFGLKAWPIRLSNGKKKRPKR